MKLLLVSATKLEILPLLDALGIKTTSEGLYTSQKADVLLTGVGMTATAFYLGACDLSKYELIVNAGIAGSFSKKLEVGQVVQVTQDRFAEMGAEDGESFLPFEELKLPGKIVFENNYTVDAVSTLTKVKGITVNKVHGNDNSIMKTTALFNPDIESMEGAAFMMACENKKVKHLQIRSISNYVERRNRNAWNIPLAVKNLNDILLSLIS